MLQWGHLVVEVEGRIADQMGPRESKCFNGATSSSRWKDIQTVVDGRLGHQLQWGHLVVEVEGSEEPPSTFATPCFNGATSSSRWKGTTTAKTLRIARIGFNGATSSSRWKEGSPPMSVRPEDALQWGHLVVEVEGLPSGIRSTIYSSPLQWGHLVVEVEGARRIGEWVIILQELQWGHLVVEVEGRGCCRPPAAERRRFNGATSSSRWKG